MTDDHVEPVYLDGGRTVLVGAAARQYRAARTVPLRVGDRIVGTATIKDGVADCTITAPDMKSLFQADLSEVSISFPDGHIIEPRLENP